MHYSVLFPIRQTYLEKMADLGIKFQLLIIHLSKLTCDHLTHDVLYLIEKPCLFNQLIIMVNSSPPKTISKAVCLRIISQSTCAGSIVSKALYPCGWFTWIKMCIYSLRISDAHSVWRSGSSRSDRGRECSDGFVIIGFLLPQSAISQFVLSLYHSTCHKRIRKQEAGKSSTWKILATLIKKLHHLPSAYHSWISPQHIAFPPSVYTFSSSFHFSSCGI